MTEDRLTHLFKTYGPTIYIRCRGILGDEAEAHDATQETFLRVYRHLDRVPGDREALYWIYRVATNYCLNEIRDRRHRPVAGGQDLAQLPAALDAERRIEDRDFAARLIAAAHPKVRPVAWLYHIDGLEQAEVAEVLDLSRRTVISRLKSFLATARKFARGGGL